ncbi:MAG: recombinase family protein [Pseudomonadota bacterium]
MTTVGYTRVSSTGQKLAVQIDKLKAHGCQKIYQEKISGVDQNRPQLKACLDYLREGDTLVIPKFDQLARSTSHFGRIVDDGQKQGIHLVVLDQAIDTSRSTGKLMFHMLSAFAEFENNLRKERQMDGIRQAQASGIQLGHPRTITKEMINNMKKDRKAGMTISEIMGKYSVSKSSVYRAID